MRSLEHDPGDCDGESQEQQIEPLANSRREKRKGEMTNRGWETRLSVVSWSFRASSRCFASSRYHRATDVRTGHDTK